MNASTTLANRMLERESWARERLAVHGGRSFAIISGPLVAAMCIDPSGLLASYALAEGAPDLRLSISPWAVPGFLSDPTRWDSAITAEGDPALAATLRELAQTTPFWVEQLFSQWLGPIAGQRLAGAGRHALAFPGHAARRIAESIASYGRDQAGLFASYEEARLFAEQAAALDRRAEVLAARLDTLTKEAQASTRRPTHGGIAAAP